MRMRTRSESGSARRRNAAFGAVVLFLALAVPARALPQESKEERSPASLDALLAELASFEYGADDGALFALRSYVRSHRNDPGAMEACETAFLAFLEGEAVSAGKQAVCRELGLIGTDRSVPVLERMLIDEGTSDMARYGLEGIPGGVAAAALIRALGPLRGDARLGVVSSLGNRTCVAAVPALGKLLRSSNGKEAGAAADALGRIGGTDSARALTAVASKAPARVRERAASALLACGDGLLARGDAVGASAAFEKILSAGPTPSLRRAAFRGKVMAAGPEGKGIILGALGGKPPDMVQPAIDMIPGVLDAATIPLAAALMARLPLDGRVQLIAALASFPKESVLGTLTKAVDSSLVVVRVEALRALGRIGDGSVAVLLAARAASASGRERETARESLRRLGGADVDKAVLDGLIGAGPEAVRLELVRAIGERRIPGGKEVLLGLARSDTPAIRRESIQALGRLAGAEDLIPLIDLLSAAQDESEQEEIGNAIAETALEHARPDERAGAVESRLAAKKDPKERAVLLLVLGMIGEDRTLPIVREALADSDPRVADAAARAIAAWPTAVARDDALRIARISGNLVLRVLALEGYVRMVGLERYRAPEGAVASLRVALALAGRPEERRLVLGALPAFACPEALALAEELAGSPDIGGEARVAAESIRKELASRKR
jgi:HEAT repeat protein